MKLDDKILSQVRTPLISFTGETLKALVGYPLPVQFWKSPNVAIATVKFLVVDAGLSCNIRTRKAECNRSCSFHLSLDDEVSHGELGFKKDSNR